MTLVEILYATLTFGSLGLANENIALNKPAYQSSVYSASYSTVPGNAVDGNLMRDLREDGCSVTSDDDLNPWWMVDLGKPYKIHNMKMINRKVVERDFLHDFYIEAFLEHPLVWNSTTPQQCLYYDGILWNIETITCDGPVTGRYVRIRKVSRPGKVRLTLCEVEIRGVETPDKLVLPECNPKRMPIHGGKRLETLFKEVAASNTLPDCLSRCLHNVACYDINYNRPTQICELIQARSDTDVLIEDQEWTFMSLA